MAIRVPVLFGSVVAKVVVPDAAVSAVAGSAGASGGIDEARQAMWPSGRITVAPSSLTP